MTDDTQLTEILSRLTTIAEALGTGTPPPRTPATPEQSATIVDFLVLSEVVGRIADGTSRVVSAERRTGGVLAFADAVPVGRRRPDRGVHRSGQPGRDRPRSAPLSARAARPSAPVTLGTVTDNQPIIRIEIRRADDITVALGPRLAAVG